MKQTNETWFKILLILLLAVLCILLLWRDKAPLPEDEYSDTTISGEAENVIPNPPEGILSQVEGGLPQDKLFITAERQAYKDGDLALRIPKLDVNEPVLSGVDPATLKRGIGLYDYAQLPGEGNPNVSIAGHRNGLRKGKITDTVPFYYLDTLTAGDYLYLIDSQHIYRYLYHDTEIVEANDWRPIYSQGYSCLTLTSCHPIGVADHRIIVRSELDMIFDARGDFDYITQK
jgi:LPXTG-site transpeptidase (sortase) family protein